MKELIYPYFITRNGEIWNKEGKQKVITSFILGEVMMPNGFRFKNY